MRRGDCRYEIEEWVGIDARAALLMSCELEVDDSRFPLRVQMEAARTTWV